MSCNDLAVWVHVLHWAWFMGISHRRKLSIAGVVLCAALAGGCGGSPTSPSGNARLDILLTDAPFDDAMAVLVTFAEVSVHRDDTGWTTLPFADEGSMMRTCDLKKLQGAQDVLGTGGLTAGHYTQIRLTISAAALFFDTEAVGEPCAPLIEPPPGSMAVLDIPSGELKLNRPFDLSEDGATTILLDLDGHASIHETGNGRFMMSPVVSVVSVQ